MIWKTILKVGLRVCVAAIAGLAVFIGIDKVNKNNNEKTEKPEGGPKKTGMENLSSNEPVPEESVVQKMRNIQGTLGKLFACVQALTLVVESFRKILSGTGENNGGGYYNTQPYYLGSNPFYSNYGYYPQQTYTSEDGVIFNRISPFITEVICNNSNRGYRGV